MSVIFFRGKRLWIVLTETVQHETPAVDYLIKQYKLMVVLV